jgi:hypothetical protein
VQSMHFWALQVLLLAHTHTSPETSTQSNAAALSPLPTGLIGKVAV